MTCMCWQSAVELPKLPVPALETTLSKYLQMARVLLTDSQYERTRAAVRAFGIPGGVGHRLQRYILDKQQAEENWVSIFRTFYDASNISLISYHNPIFMVNLIFF
jgi:hypothetical protein